MININDPCVLIRLDLSYPLEISEDMLLNRTKSEWVLNVNRAKKADYAMAVVNGIIVEVYVINSWHLSSSKLSEPKFNPKTNKISKQRTISRYEFKGEVAAQSIRNKYVNQSIKHLFKSGNSNPINYKNI